MSCFIFYSLLGGVCIFFVAFVDDMDIHFEFGSAYFFVESDLTCGLIEKLVSLEAAYAGDDF